MISKDYRMWALAPSDSIQAALDRFKGNSCSVAFIGHALIDSLDDFFLNCQHGRIKLPFKACPRNPMPNQGSAFSTIYRFEI
jgi:hypothetical protein